MADLSSGETAAAPSPLVPIENESEDQEVNTETAVVMSLPDDNNASLDIMESEEIAEEELPVKASSGDEKEVQETDARTTENVAVSTAPADLPSTEEKEAASVSNLRKTWKKKEQTTKRSQLLNLNDFHMQQRQERVGDKLRKGEAAENLHSFRNHDTPVTKQQKSDGTIPVKQPPPEQTKAADRAAMAQYMFLRQSKEKESKPAGANAPHRTLSLKTATVNLAPSRSGDESSTSSKSTKSSTKWRKSPTSGGKNVIVTDVDEFYAQQHAIHLENERKKREILHISDNKDISPDKSSTLPSPKYKKTVIPSLVDSLSADDSLAIASSLSMDASEAKAEEIEAKPRNLANEYIEESSEAVDIGKEDIDVEPDATIAVPSGEVNDSSEGVASVDEQTAEIQARSEATGGTETIGDENENEAQGDIGVVSGSAAIVSRGEDNELDDAVDTHPGEKRVEGEPTDRTETSDDDNADKGHDRNLPPSISGGIQQLGPSDSVIPDEHGVKEAVGELEASKETVAVVLSQQEDEVVSPQESVDDEMTAVAAKVSDDTKQEAASKAEATPRYSVEHTAARPSTEEDTVSVNGTEDSESISRPTSDAGAVKVQEETTSVSIHKAERKDSPAEVYDTNLKGENGTEAQSQEIVDAGSLQQDFLEKLVTDALDETAASSSIEQDESVQESLSIEATEKLTDLQQGDEPPVPEEVEHDNEDSISARKGSESGTQASPEPEDDGGTTETGDTSLVADDIDGGSLDQASPTQQPTEAHLGDQEDLSCVGDDEDNGFVLVEAEDAVSEACREKEESLVNQQVAAQHVDDKSGEPDDIQTTMPREGEGDEEVQEIQSSPAPALEEVASVEHSVAARQFERTSADDVVLQCREEPTQDETIGDSIDAGAEDDNAVVSSQIQEHEAIPVMTSSHIPLSGEMLSDETTLMAATKDISEEVTGTTPKEEGTPVASTEHLESELVDHVPDDISKVSASDGDSTASVDGDILSDEREEEDSSVQEKDMVVVSSAEGELVDHVPDDISRASSSAGDSTASVDGDIFSDEREEGGRLDQIQEKGNEEADKVPVPPTDREPVDHVPDDISIVSSDGNSTASVDGDILSDECEEGVFGNQEEEKEQECIGAQGVEIVEIDSTASVAGDVCGSVVGAALREVVPDMAQSEEEPWDEGDELISSINLSRSIENELVSETVDIESPQNPSAVSAPSAVGMSVEAAVTASEQETVDCAVEGGTDPADDVAGELHLDKDGTVEQPLSSEVGNQADDEVVTTAIVEIGSEEELGPHDESVLDELMASRDDTEGNPASKEANGDVASNDDGSGDDGLEKEMPSDETSVSEAAETGNAPSLIRHLIADDSILNVFEETDGDTSGFDSDYNKVADPSLQTDDHSELQNVSAINSVPSKDATDVSPSEVIAKFIKSGASGDTGDFVAPDGSKAGSIVSSSTGTDSSDEPNHDPLSCAPSAGSTDKPAATNPGAKVEVDYKNADYRGFVFVVHKSHGLMLLYCTRKRKKGPHYQLPGGHVDEPEFFAAAEESRDAQSQLLLASRAGAARELYEETGMDVRFQLDRLEPAALKNEVELDKHGKPILTNELKRRLYFFLAVTDDDFWSSDKGDSDAGKMHPLGAATGCDGSQLMLKLSHEHQGWTFEKDPNKSAEMLAVHSGGQGAIALRMSMARDGVTGLSSDQKPAAQEQTTKELQSETWETEPLVKDEAIGADSQVATTRAAPDLLPPAEQSGLSKLFSCCLWFQSTDDD